MPRHFGLDVARALAIACVLVSHLPLVGPSLLPAWVNDLLGIFGVELFFVLSGLLIGEILLRDLTGPEGLGRFWARRWLRTLPAYAVTLAVIWLTFGNWSWRNLAFLQNSSPEALSVLPVSWSLSIEEWFYVAFPVLLLGLRRLMPIRPAFLVGVVIFLAVPAALRLALSCDASLTWDRVFRKQVPLRLDAPAFGLLLAWLRRFRPLLWARLEGRAVSLVAGLAVLGLVAVWSRDLRLTAPVGGLADLLLLPAVSLGCLLVIAWLRGSAGWPASRMIGALVLWGSRLSYGLYLAHWYLFYAWELHVHELAPWMNVVGALALTCAGAWILQVLIERPALRLRDRLT